MKVRAVLLFFFLSSLLACVSPAGNQGPSNSQQGNAGSDPNKKIKIGFAMATVKEERWQRDRDAFEAHCKKMDVECVLTFADNKAEKQLSDVEQLLTQGINVLVIAPQEAT